MKIENARANVQYNKAHHIDEQSFENYFIDLIVFENQVCLRQERSRWCHPAQRRLVF